MEIKRYKKDKHSDLVTGNIHLEPGDKFEDLRQAAKNALKDAKDVHQFSTNFEIVVALTDKSEFEEDVNPDYLFMGLSLHEGMRGSDKKVIFIRGVTGHDGWRRRFKDMLVHEIGHQVFYQKNNHSGRSQFYNLRFEGHAENFASKVSNKKNYGYKPPWRTEKLNLETETDQIIQDLEVNRQWPDQTENLSKQLFIRGGERYQMAEGYTIAYQVVKSLINKGQIKLSKIPEMSSENWRKSCESAIRELYE